MANYGGRQPNNTAYIKNFVPGTPSDLWSVSSYYPAGTNNNYSVLVPSSDSYNNVYVPGNLYVDGSIINPSDINLKENINIIDCDKTNKILNLKPCEFTYKNDDKSQIHFGFIAQEFEKEIPELIYTKPDGVNESSNLKAINYLEIIPLLVNKIQLMEKEIDELREQIIKK
jgi:hypothetical protein